jgi:hypothetical protein
MPDEVNAGGAATSGGGSSASGATGGSAPTGGSGTTTSTTPQTDIEFLSAPEPKAPETKTSETTAPEKTVPDLEEINLSALEEASPDWFGKITDEAAKGEVQKLLDLQKSFADKFKDAPEELFKALPGGKEQLTALQTLSKEVIELDGHIAANTPESNAIVVGRYLGEAPDQGVGLFRAGAHHLAKTNPEAWNQIAGELVNSTLESAGIGANFNELISGIQEMRQAIQKDDGEGLGKALARILGEPQKKPASDPNAERQQSELAAAKAERTAAQTESWKFRNERSSQKIDNHIHSEAGKLLTKVLPASISEKDRASLRDSIYSEVISQMLADQYRVSKAVALIGHSKPDGKGGIDYSNANLTATQEHWDQMTNMVLESLTPQLLNRAVSKVVTQWSKDRAASNKEARERSRGAAPKTDVGAGKTPANGKGKKPLTEEQFRKMDDIEFLSY